MTMMTLSLPSEKQTEQLACQLSKVLYSPLVLTFRGEIGAGKTTLIRSMLQSLGVQSAIKSPTFSLIESYFINGLHIHHFDLYRIHEAEALEYLGFRDYFTNDAVCLIEWPQRASGYLEQADLEFNLLVKGDGRMLHAVAHSKAGSELLASMTGE